MRKTIIAAATLALCAFGADALTINKAEGWLESAYAEWSPAAGAAKYEVSVSGEDLDAVKVDEPLVRQYASGIRVDVPGLKAGSYTLAVSALNESGDVIDSGTTEELTVIPLLREGFAFTEGNVPGAYNLDGTLKTDARVLYVTAKSVNTVTCDVVIKAGKDGEMYTGVTNILNAYGKGIDKRPLALRVIGSIDETEFADLKDGNYINFQGNNNTEKMIENITLEGIGFDATLHGYGICFKRAHNIEVRNLAIMLFGDDAVSMDTDNTNIWIHNNEFYYGKPGSDADQVKGDGSIDMKYYSTFVTIDHNRFVDSGKVMGCGGATGEKKGNLSITFHHNWFDHADSRCPRLHYVTAHIYNNYYDGVAVYGIGNTSETSAFVESNYFRNVKRPMMISGQGTDKYDEATGTYSLKGTFSGQAGGMTKAYDNKFAEVTPKYVNQHQNAVQFDAYEVADRGEVIPETVVSFNGAWQYSNFDTAEAMYLSVPDLVDLVPGLVMKYAGRLGGGDINWRFDNSKDDADHDLNTLLKAALTGYKSGLLAVQGETEFVGTDALDETVYGACEEIFDLQGRRVACALTDLPKGVYILRSGDKVLKIAH